MSLYARRWHYSQLAQSHVIAGYGRHQRFSHSFPDRYLISAGSGLVAFAAATGVMPLDMPESVLVRFKGEMQAGVTLRDLVHAIPLFAIKQGLLTVEKTGKKNSFSGRILEIEGLENLTSLNKPLSCLTPQSRAFCGRLYHHTVRRIDCRISAFKRHHAALDDQ